MIITSQVPKITWDYIILLIYIIFDVIFLWIRWPFISRSLSEGGAPSSKRLNGFWVIQAAMLCEVFYVIKKGDLPLYHLIAWLVFASICLGLATTAQIIDAWKGKGTTQTTIEASSQSVISSTTTTEQ